MRRPARAALPPGSLALADAFAAGAALQRAPVALDGSDLLLLQYTGGTTGLSKGAALSHRNLIANVEHSRRSCRRAAAGRGGRRHGDSAVPHLRADGELPVLLRDRRAELARRQSARHGRPDRRAEGRAAVGVRRRQHAVCGSRAIRG
jgi:acyl-CoA synthetase (AMP-forming)/AMP-acid ligase II